MEISVQKGYGLTQNGNEYKKSKIAKTIACVGGTTALAATTLGACADIVSISKGKKPMGGFILGLPLLVPTLLGSGIGALVDHFIVNKNRKEEADGAAAQQEKLQLQA